jgi:hypothetical protein
MVIFGQVVILLHAIMNSADIRHELLSFSSMLIKLLCQI